MEMKKLFLSALILFLLTFFSGRAETKELLFADIITNYANIALAGYEDSLIMAGKLDQAIKQLLDKPSVTALAKARKAWIDARVPYQQTEVYRFGNKIVDDWEGRINAWPLDEGLIDYVQNGDDTTGGENELYNANVIANPVIMIDGKEVDARVIDKNLIANVLHEAGGIEANVSTGYHAIEFLLWGQDLSRDSAGQRPYTDFSLAECTGGNCDRRRQYLQALSDLLIDDLAEMVAHWQPDGDARAAIMEDPKKSITVILTGMGSLSYGELAGERMKLGLLLHDQEEESDCFSDNTHNSIFYNIAGIANVYHGRYKRVDNSVVEGASLSDLVALRDEKLAASMESDLTRSIASARKIVAAAEGGEHYDKLISQGNDKGNKLVDEVINHLITQTRTIERIVSTLNAGNITIEGSNSLSESDAVFE